MRLRRKLYKHTRADQQRKPAPGGTGDRRGLQDRFGKTHQNHKLFGGRIVKNTPCHKRSTLIRSYRKNKSFIFYSGGRRPATGRPPAGHRPAPHKSRFRRPSPEGITALTRPHIVARTHARTHRNRNRNRNRFPGWVDPSTSNIYTYKTSLKADKEFEGCFFF